MELVYIVLYSTIWLNTDGSFSSYTSGPNPAYSFKTEEDCEKRVAWELEYGATLSRENGKLIAKRNDNLHIDFYKCIAVAHFE